MADFLDRDHVLHDRPGAEGGQRRGVLGDVLAGDDADDAGQRLGLRGVDGDDLRVRVRAADDRRVEHPRELDVVEVPPLAAEEAWVLDPVQALAEPAALPAPARCPRATFAAFGSCTAMLIALPPAAARIESTMCW